MNEKALEDRALDFSPRSTERAAVHREWGYVLIPLFCVAAPSLSAQRDTLKVGLSVTERTDGLVESVFRTALSGLQGVVVVTAQEGPDVLLRVVVLCQPSKEDCEHATNYAVAVTLAEPLTTASVLAPMTLGSRRAHPVGALRQLTWAQRDSIATLIAKHLAQYELPDQTWAASWPRTSYRHAVEEFVAQLDSKCFERHRLAQRSLRLGFGAGDSIAARALYQRVLDSANTEGWICEMM